MRVERRARRASGTGSRRPPTMRRRGEGRRRSVRARPGGRGRGDRFGRCRSAPRDRFSGEPSGRGVLTRSRQRPPTGGDLAFSGPPGRFQPGPVARRRRGRAVRRRVGDRFARRDPRGDLHASNRSPPGTTPTPADGRSPLDHPRPPSGRQLDGLPGDGASLSMGPVRKGADRISIVTRRAGLRVLNWLGSGRGYARGGTGITLPPLREKSLPRT
jgi:hypothetical protein